MVHKRRVSSTVEPSEGSGVHLANVLMAEEGIHIYLWCHFYSLHIHSALFLGSSSSSSSSSSASVSFLCCVVCAQHSYYMWLPHCMSSFLSYVPLFHIYHPLPPATTLDKYLATYPLWFHSHCYDMLLMVRRSPWFRLLLTLFQQAVLLHPSQIHHKRIRRKCNYIKDYNDWRRSSFSTCHRFNWNKKANSGNISRSWTRDDGGCGS